MYGAAIGDIAGSRFEFGNIKHKEFELINDECYATDDTVCTVAIAKALLKCNGDYSNLDKLCVKYLQEFVQKYPDMGYGGFFYEWGWSDDPRPYNSFGNGSAMRVSACGWLAKSLKEAEELAEITASVTHNHLEGIKGAKAIAASIYLAKEGKSKEEIANYVSNNYYPELNMIELDDIREFYDWDVTCQGSVPIAIQAFYEGNSFEDVVKTGISMGGDSDTIGAMAGSIAEAYYGIDKRTIKKVKEYLPEEFVEILDMIQTK